MQGRGTLPRRKLILLAVMSIAAIGSLLIAPEGAVSQMLASMAEPENLQLTSPKPLPPLAFLGEETKGKVVVVNFWALWCPSCKVEKPKLDKLQADYAKKGLVVLTVSDAGDDLEAVRQYFASHNITHLKPLQDEGSNAFRALKFRGLPSTLIVDKDGKEIARAEGMVDWDSKDVRKYLDQVLAESGN